MSKLRNKKHTPSSSSSSLSSSSASSSSASSKQPHLSDQRKSYYFTRDFTLHPNSPSNTCTTVSDKHSPTEPPRKSTRRRRSTRKSARLTKNPAPPARLVSSSISAGCSCRATIESVWTKPPDECAQTSSSSEHDSMLTEYGSDRDRGLSRDETFDGAITWSNGSCKCKTENDIVFKLDFDRVSDFDLPQINTRKHDQPTKIQRTSAEFSERNAYGSLSVKVVKEDFLSTKSTTSPIRRFSGNLSSPAGVKLRTNTPRIANRRIQGRKSVSSANSSAASRRSVSESFAVVKTSKDPKRDFRESMVEMIVENNIRSSKDLEELLACYLSLNSDEYHEVIINVFKQIWFDYIHVRLK
ncbi:hypothetical protein DH2020_036785 [Rehmannia glutinosa]|uniref:Transcription repressor n=1 Tax=Rehmannia glutinosa TaxID=99300 RepID=A0ABR0V3T3_REHGL